MRGATLPHPHGHDQALGVCETRAPVAPLRRAVGSRDEDGPERVRAVVVTLLERQVDNIILGAERLGEPLEKPCIDTDGEAVALDRPE